MTNPPPTPISIVIGRYLHKACHVYFHEWMFHYNTEQHGGKSHQRRKRIRRDRLFPLVKKGRGACCIVVPLIKSRESLRPAPHVLMYEAETVPAAPTPSANTRHARWERTRDRNTFRAPKLFTDVSNDVLEFR